MNLEEIIKKTKSITRRQEKIEKEKEDIGIEFAKPIFSKLPKLKEIVFETYTPHFMDGEPIEKCHYVYYNRRDSYYDIESGLIFHESRDEIETPLDEDLAIEVEAGNLNKNTDYFYSFFESCKTQQDKQNFLALKRVMPCVFGEGSLGKQNKNYKEIMFFEEYLGEFFEDKYNTNYRVFVYQNEESKIESAKVPYHPEY